MVQPPCLVALQELRAFPGAEHQINCLRRLKNDIVGHGLRKELVIRHGLLETLEGILSSAVNTSGKRSAPHNNGSAYTGHPVQQSWEVEDEIRLQATLILGLIANGGPTFVDPLEASNIVPLLFNALSREEVPPKIINATLRTLIDLAKSSALRRSSDLSPTQSPLWASSSSKSTARSYSRLLNGSLENIVERQRISLTAELIYTACIDEKSRNALVNAGVLDQLSGLLAASASDDRTGQRLPHLRIDSIFITNVLNALWAIVWDSHYRAQYLILSESWRPASSGEDKTEAIQLPSYASQNRASSVNKLIPKVLVPSNKSVTFGSQSFPALSSSKGYVLENSVAEVNASSPLLVWLIYLLRSQKSTSCRVAAMKLLALVSTAMDCELGNRGNPGSRVRERQEALLAVPVAVQLVSSVARHKADLVNDDDEAQSVPLDVCSVLAELIKGSQELQNTAEQAGAIKYTAQILKRSFESVELARPMWVGQSYSPADLTTQAASARMGSSGLPIEIMSAMQARAGALRAIAAIASKDDKHRKMVIDQGVITCIIDSLTSFSSEALAGSTKPGPRDGNTIAVLIAACEAANSLSRSVSLLRTSLIDAGIAKPILALLQHPDSGVQVAATNVSCNLVLDFSPMRQDLVDAGAVRIMCEHARRSNPKLRLASLWALKHLVLNAPRDQKIEALDELGTGWLVQAISGEQRTETQSSTPIGMGTSNAAGEQVDLLNAPNSPEMDVDISDEEQAHEDDEDGELQFDPNGTPYHSSGLRSTLQTNTASLAKLKTLRENEQNPAIQAQQDDTDIQEQALDFVRNLINGDEGTAMIDHLNAAIGSQRIFDLLTSKLEPTSPVKSGTGGIAAATAQRTSPQQVRSQYQHPRIINAAIHVLNHIAAASPRHKQLLTAQKALLRAWVPHFTSHERGIRVISAWAVINLTWVDDQSEREDARRRAQELRVLGIEDKVRSLANDPELDVRERVKTAIRQFEELLDTRHR